MRPYIKWLVRGQEKLKNLRMSLVSHENGLCQSYMMAEIVKFPVLTPGDLLGANAGVAALYRRLPDNPSVELLDLAITALLDYYSFLVLKNDEDFFRRHDDQVKQAAERLDELRRLMAAWHHRQWIRLGAP